MNEIKLKHYRLVVQEVDILNGICYPGKQLGKRILSELSQEEALKKASSLFKTFEMGLEKKT